MPYIVQLARKYRSVIVVLNQNGEEKTVHLRNDDVAYSMTMTTDLRSQAKMKYVTCKFVDKIEESAPVEKPRVFSQDDILTLSHSQLRKLAELNGIDTSDLQEEDDLRDVMLAFDTFPWVDPSKLGE